MLFISLCESQMWINTIKKIYSAEITVLTRWHISKYPKATL